MAFVVTLLTFHQPNENRTLVRRATFKRNLFFSFPVSFFSFPVSFFLFFFLLFFFLFSFPQVGKEKRKEKKRKEKGKEKKENGKEKKEKGKEKKEKGKEKKERLQDWAQIRGSRWLSLPPQLTNWCRSPPVVVWAR